MSHIRRGACVTAALVAASLVTPIRLTAQTAAAASPAPPAASASAAASVTNSTEENCLAYKKTITDLTHQLTAQCLADRFVSVRREWVTDDTAVFTVTLNRVSSIKAKLFNDINGTRSFMFSVDSKDKVTHTLHFQNLNPGTYYRVALVVLNDKGGETRLKANPDDYADTLVFKTEPQSDAPDLQFGVDEVVYNKVTMHFTASEPLALHVKCKKHKKDSLETDVVDSKGSDLSEDPLYRVVGGVKLDQGQEKSFTCALEPETQYSIEWEAKCIRTSKSLPTRPRDFPLFTTPPIPQPFEFANELSIVIKPASVQLLWNATAKPDAASAELILDEATKQVTSTSSITELLKRNADGGISPMVQVVVDIPMSSLSAAQDSVKAPLRLRAIMSKGSAVRKMAVAVKVDMSNRDGLSKDQSEALDRITEAASDHGRKARRNLNWGDFVKVGLPIVLKFL
jgi:hypothetical protein